MPRLYENRIIGPPGTGKTTTLAKYVRGTVEKYGSDAVMVASFTKAAAAEIAGRDLPVAPSQVGTLHHFAYTALDHPDVAETKIPDWNERQEAAGRPHFKLTPSKRDLDDMDEDLGTEAEGDELYNRLEIYRARMIDRRTWDSEVLSFANAWEAWKREARVIDFTDMIEMALLATDEAPGSPRVGFMDECLAGDSLITLADGSRLPIRVIVKERLLVRVLSYNPALDTVEPKKVLGWRRVPRRGRPIVRLDSLGATYNHPVYTRERAYVQAGAMLPQQHVLYLDHEKVRYYGTLDEGAVLPRARVSSWRCVAAGATDHLPTEDDVYCLIVEDNHNFFADGILVSNCQDFTPLEMALVRKWGAQMDTLFVVGDPQQCLYDFKGASPEAFRNPPVPKSQQKVLDQSYRLPRQVHALAQRWIAQESTPFEYKPRDYEGEVRFEDSLSFRFPESLLVDAAKYLELGKTVMFLTTCGYMLDNLRHLLLEQGIPFHNPYRYSQPAWNPLRPGRGVASKDRLLAYLRPDPSASDRPQHWSPDDLKLWTAALRAEGTLRRGAKTALEGSGGGGECSDDFLEELFEAQSLARALDLDLDWLEQNLLASRRKGMEFPLRVARRWGAKMLRETPRCIVGTVHSTKGGEAECVYLCPDIAVPAMEQWEAGGEGRNAIVRQMYVGLSRARESLIICGPSSHLAVEIE